MLPIIALLFSYALTSKYRSTVSLFLFFLVGICMFQVGSNYFIEWDLSKKMKIIINRVLLLFIIGGLLLSVLLSKQKVFLFASLPDWQKRIVMPYHSIKLTYFLLFGLIGSATIFVPLLFVEDISYTKSFVIYGIVFSVINAILEELLWRGIMLSHLKSNLSTFYAVFITSIGFGLLHISIGIPVIMSLLFSFGGLFYAFVVLKTKSIYPAIVFHFIINLGMVFNGWIF
ncbi:MULTISPECIES: CPBP family intramembrane glutamic endopeptidase [Priestia]|nr:CPBP family intramembrane glutamic endopeptidase [Priestia megaterium]MDC7768698.1 CPBP family intramembrane metalloprotease [Priestia megaterium]